MMKDLVIPAEEVEGNSYVAIADGYKRHNMCKIYAGFYDYDDETVERSKQQRVPMILVAKCVHHSKPTAPSLVIVVSVTRRCCSCVHAEGHVRRANDCLRVRILQQHLACHGRFT